MLGPGRGTGSTPSRCELRDVDLAVWKLQPMGIGMRARACAVAWAGCGRRPGRARPTQQDRLDVASMRMDTAPSQPQVAGTARARASAGAHATRDADG